jgi:2-dehydropantoate 2-reductase
MHCQCRRVQKGISMSQIYDYTILGAGAVGSVFGGLLTQAGFRVQLVNRSAETGKAIAENGLRLDLSKGDVVCHPDAVQPQDAAPARFVMAFTKTHQTEAALLSIRDAMRPRTVFVTLQNGLGNAELVAQVTGSAQVLHGVTMLPATLLAPGHVRSHGSSQTWIGPVRIQDLPLAQTVHDDLRRAGFDMVLADDPAGRIWQKACFNVALNGVCALAMGSPGLIQATDGLQDQAHALADEAIAVAVAEGAVVDSSAVHKLIDFACAEHTYHKPSMLQDIEAGRLTEVDTLNGHVVARAAVHRLDVPLNKLILTLIKARQDAPVFWQGAPTSN